MGNPPSRTPIPPSLPGTDGAALDDNPVSRELSGELSCNASDASLAALACVPAAFTGSPHVRSRAASVPLDVDEPLRARDTLREAAPLTAESV